MRNRYFIFFIALLFVISSIGFCQEGTSSTTTTTGPATSTNSTIADTQTLKSLVISITAIEKVTKAFPDVGEEEISQLNEQLFVALNQTNRFGKVYSNFYDPNANGDYKLNISITVLHRVSEATRFWVGPMAGKAIVAADINLTDTVSGKILDSRKIEGLSSVGLTYNNSTTGTAVNAAVQKIMAFVINAMNAIK